MRFRGGTPRWAACMSWLALFPKFVDSSSRTYLAAHVKGGGADARGEQRGSEKALEVHLEQRCSKRE